MVQRPIEGILTHARMQLALAWRGLTLASKLTHALCTLHRIKQSSGSSIARCVGDNGDKVQVRVQTSNHSSVAGVLLCARRRRLVRRQAVL